MKRKFSLILTMLLMALVISACGNKEKEEPIAKKEEETVKPDAEIAVDKSKEEDTDVNNNGEKVPTKDDGKNNESPIKDEDQSAKTPIKKSTSQPDIFIDYYYANGALAGDIKPNKDNVIIYSGTPREELVPISVNVGQKIHIESSEQLKGKYDLTFESDGSAPVEKMINSNQEVVGKGRFMAVIKPNWNENVDTLYVLFECK